MGKIMVIGCGGTGNAAIYQCCRHSEFFSEVVIADRDLSRCEALKKKLEGTTDAKIIPVQVDVDDTAVLTELIREERPEAVLNLTPPCEDLLIMEACLAAGVHYIDTSAYEPEETAVFEYKWQWEYRDRFEKAGLTALLGCGADPGLTEVFCAYALKHYFDEINHIDIFECNTGENGHPFAAGVNPQTGLRRLSLGGAYWKDGSMIETEPLAISQKYRIPEIGERDMYLIRHEEPESLALHVPGIKRIRFFKSFSERDIAYLKCLEELGLTSIEPVRYEDQEIVPLEFLSTFLPDPSSLAAETRGKVSVGCLLEGKKDGKEKKLYFYSICDHEECYNRSGSQAAAYMSGLPAMIGTMLVMNGTWKKAGVFNVEEFDPDPFMELMNKWGLNWKVSENPRL